MRRRRILGVLAIAVALLIAGVGTAVALASFNSLSVWQMPGTETVVLEPGNWTIFEKVPDKAANTVTMSDIAKARTLTVEELAVSGPTGAVALSCAYCDSEGTAVPIDLALYNAVASFKAETKGQYRITSSGESGQLALGDPAGKLNAVMPWLLLMSMLALASLVAGILLLARAGLGRQLTGRGPGPGRLPPPGWYPNPYLEGTTSEMWWDGKQWTSNWR